MDKEIVESKKQHLIRRLEEADSLLVSYSGGVDSSLLLALAHQVLGEAVVAATAVSAVFPVREQEQARRFTQERGIEHIFFSSQEMLVPDFVRNGPDRCYHCKKPLFQALLKTAEQRGMALVAHGANADDPKDHRPGLQAAQEMGIIAPLMEVGLAKEEIRFLAREMGLSQWDKPPMACLATRVPYGSRITPEKLKMIEEAEGFLFEAGIRQCRVRHHGSVARIELDAEGRNRIMDHDLREAVVRKFREIGFNHVAVDLEGYVSGSMNRALDRATSSLSHGVLEWSNGI